MVTLNKYQNAIKYGIAGCMIILLIFAMYYAYYISFGKNKNSNTGTGVQKTMGGVEKFKNHDTEVILLYTPTCPYCIKFHPTFNKVSSLYANKASFKSISDIPENMMQYVEGYPTTVVFQKGTFVDKIVGNVSEDTFREFITKYIVI